MAPIPSTVSVDVPYTDTIVGVLKQYYHMVESGTSHRQILIQDQTLKEAISGFGTNPEPQVALMICKILILLSDQRRHCQLMVSEGYMPLIGELCEQQMPPKLLTKFLQVQSRLTRSQKHRNDESMCEGSVATQKRAQARSKEQIFVLPLLNEMQQQAVSQAMLQVQGHLSVSFTSCADKHETLAIVRVRMHVEPIVCAAFCRLAQCEQRREFFALARCARVAAASRARLQRIADAILSAGLENVGYVLKNEQGNEEIFTFYADENTTPPAENLPQYLDDNIEVFDPTSAVATKDFKTCGQASGGWLTSAAKSIFSFW